jgi:hypothetical protein
VHRYQDDEYEYRHVQLPKQMLKAIPKDYFDGARGTLKLLWEEEWRALGITQVCAAARQREPWTDAMAELGLGTLRGARARTTHPALQVSFPSVAEDTLTPPQATDQLPASDALMRPPSPSSQSGTLGDRL